MIKIKDRFLTAIALVCLLLGITACNNQHIGMPMGGGVPVETMVLSSSPVTQSSIYQATLISRRSISLQPQVSGQIAKIYVKAGDHVKAGQLLLVFNKKKSEAALNFSRADAEAAKALISQAQSTLYNYQVQKTALISNLDLNKKLYDRYTALYEKHSVSKQDLEKYTDALNKAQAALDENNAQIETQKSAIEVAKCNYQKALFLIKEQEVSLNYYSITAPYSGIIGDIPVKAGNYVTSSTQLLSITQNDTLEINVGLPVEKVFEIHADLPVEVLDNIGNIVGSSKISFVSPKVDTDTQTILVKAILHNSTSILKADQSVKVRVIYNKANGILAPTSSISHFGGQDFVFLVNKKETKSFVKQLPVKLGDIQDDKYVVLSGIKAGDEIVTQGLQKLMDGAPITILPISPKGAK